MNDSNLENLLRSWTPRRPSASLEQRIFAPESAPGANVSHGPDGCGAGHFRHWRLALASPLGMGLALLALIASLAGVGHFATSPSAHNPGAALLASVALSNQHAPSYMTAAVHSEHNSWFKTWTVSTFGMDNGQHSHSSNASFPLWKTNFYRP